MAGEFNKYPYTNFHELNLEYFIKKFDEIFTKWSELYDTMIDWKSDTTEELETWKTSVEDDLDARETALRAELETWKDATEADISDWEVATLAALNNWKDAAEAAFEVIRVQAAASATEATNAATAAGNAKTAAETAQAAAEAAAASVTASAAQISTNTTNIGKLRTEMDIITASNKNLWEGDATLSFTGSYRYDFDPPLPAGRYTLSATVTSSDTDYNYSRVMIKPGSTVLDFTRGTREGHYFNASSDVTYMTFFAARNADTSAGDTASFTEIQLETGSGMTSYVPHTIIAVDSIARDTVNKIRKYVATNGNDTNDGNSPDTPYLTIGKAVSENADIITLKQGTYTETISENPAYRYKHIEIYGNGSTLQSGGNWEFRFVDLLVNDLTISYTGASTPSGFNLLNCTGVFKNCKAIGFGTSGFNMLGCRMTFINCEASANAVDGFGGDKSPQDIDSDCTFINCRAFNNGDDGASIHATGRMVVIGGEYYGNTQAGLAPHSRCVFEIHNAHCYNNGIGIEALRDSIPSGQTAATGTVNGCIIANNTTYGLIIQNYTVNTLGNAYSGNGSGNVSVGTGGTNNAYTAT